MIWPQQFAPAAIRDIEEAIDWTADERSPEIGLRLARAILHAARRVVASPLIGRSQPELLPPRFRFWAVRGFPYVLVYDASRTPPQVLRVLHMARHFPSLLAELRDASTE